MTVFLILSALLWIGFGILCFAQPSFLASSAGVTSTTKTGSIELRAMYGGVQIGLGALALAGLLREPLQPVALGALAFVALGLFTSRALATALASFELSRYTRVALAFELPYGLLAAWLLMRQLDSASV